jgi:hypothetical protein
MSDEKSNRSADTIQPMWPPDEEARVDYFGHKVYQRAIRMSTAGIIGLLMVFAGIIGFSIPSIKNWIQSYTEGQVRAEISTRIGEATERELQAQVGAIVERAEQLIRAAEEKLARVEDRLQQSEATLRQSQDQIAAALRQAQDVNLAIQQRLQSAGESAALPDPSEGAAEGGGDVDQQRTEHGEPAAGATSCPVGNLVPEQRARIAVRQSVRASAERTGERRLYDNTFRVEVQEGDTTETDGWTTGCLLAAVNRVVYSLNPSWFTPARNVRTDPADAFAYSVQVWGSTAIDIEIYLSGYQPRICIKGYLKATEQADLLLQGGSCDALAYASP